MNRVTFYKQNREVEEEENNKQDKQKPLTTLIAVVLLQSYTIDRTVIKPNGLMIFLMVFVSSRKAES